MVFANDKSNAVDDDIAPNTRFHLGRSPTPLSQNLDESSRAQILFAITIAVRCWLPRLRPPYGRAFAQPGLGPRRANGVSLLGRRSGILVVTRCCHRAQTFTSDS